MASRPPLRSASLADRKRSVTARQKARPVSTVSSNDREEHVDADPLQQGRKPSVVTIGSEIRAHTKYIQEQMIRRTTMPIKSNYTIPQTVAQTPPRPLKASSTAPTKAPATDSPTPAWNPSATLLAPSTSAALACRISVPPLAAHAPNTLHPRPFSSQTLAEQETAVIEDLLFVLMGFEGQYIQYTADYDPLDEKSRLGGPQFRIAPGLDPSLRDLTTSNLFVATSYSALELFLEMMGRVECGAVSHALCSAVRKLLKDYLILVAQLEHQHLTNPEFSLHQLSLHLKPTSHVMSQLYNLAQELLKESGALGAPEEELDMSEDMDNVLENLREGRDPTLGNQRSCKGGAILRLLTQRLQQSSGDPATFQLLNTLLQEASRPYMRMLNEWLHHGNVCDPHNEFLIKESKSIRREGLQQDYTDEYWEKRYTIRQEVLPPQFETVKDKILLAGKYLNVVRECGGITSQLGDLSSDPDLPATLDDPRCLENVSKAYAFANRSLMALLLTTHALPLRLKSLKHYFFLDRSDFFSYFLELSSSELRKPSKNVNASKLQSLLDIVLRQPGSVAAEDPFKEDIKVTMSDTGLTGWLMRVVNVQGMDADASSLSAAYTPAPGSTSGKDEKDINGYEALTLDYSVPFPLSLIISRNTLTRYQLLFRYLLSLRRLEIQLTQSWTEHIKAKVWSHRPSKTVVSSEARQRTAKIENWKRRAWTLRSRMLCFVQQLLYFCTSEVIEPNWTAFTIRLNHCADTAHPTDDSAGEKAGSEYSEIRPETQSNPLGRADDASPANHKRTVDELMQDHVDFLATCLKECMLTNSKLLRINSKVMSTCSLFADYTAHLSRYLAAVDPEFTSLSGPPSSAAPYDSTKLDKLFNILQQYEDHFSRHLKILLDALNYLAATETVVFLGLCARLSMANEGGPNATGGPDAVSTTGVYG